MIKLLSKIPTSFYLAVSGGLDSMVALDFFLQGKKDLTVVHFDHGTEFGKQARDFVERKCDDYFISLIISEIKENKKKDESPEEHWRNQRYKFFHSLDKPVVTAQHLDDAVEWWVFSSLHGEGKVMPYQNKNVIRPFLTTTRRDLHSWAERKGVEYLQDPANQDEKYMRSIIRHKIVPEALRVNPGLHTVLRKKIENDRIYS